MCSHATYCMLFAVRLMKYNLLVRNPCQKCEKFYATLSKISEGWMKPGVALSGLRQRQPPLLSFGYKKDPKFSMKPSVQLQNCPEEVFQAWSLLSRKERGNRFIKVFFTRVRYVNRIFILSFWKKIISHKTYISYWKSIWYILN